MISVTDRLTNKPINIETDATQIGHGEYILYRDEDWKQQVGVYRWRTIPINKHWKFEWKLDWELKQKFRRYQQKSNDLFKIFKPEFKKSFPQAKVISSKANIQGDTVYFYFYCEERLDFANFVREMRPNIPVKFFIYQVWARDMVRLHPEAKEWLSECGCWPVWCCGTWPLPTVEIENIALQSLEWRDIEKLKGRCWKLKCSIVFEKADYLEVAPLYPLKGSTVTINKVDMRCIGHNMMTEEVVAKSQEGEIIRTHYSNVTFTQNAGEIFSHKHWNDI